jgi:hypothetical protein
MAGIEAIQRTKRALTEPLPEPLPEPFPELPIGKDE